MERFVLLILVVVSSLLCRGQEGYRINGKIDGISSGVLYLVSDESGKPDTLGTARIVNGTFEFTGKVNSARAAYIVTAEQARVVPLILENTHFMVNMNERRVLVRGGEQQEILVRFNKLNIDLLQVQNTLQQEYNQAEQSGDRKKLKALNEQFEMAIGYARDKEDELLREYADSYVAAHVVAAGAQQLELDLLKKRYALLGDVAKQTVPGQAVAALIADMERFSEGNIVPDFTVMSQTGDSLSLYPVKGKLKLLVFWEATDLACREENVNLLDMYQKYHLRGLEIVSISRDSNVQVWEKAINTDGMFWKQGIDSSSVVFDHYHVQTVPYILLLDEENKIIAKGLKGKALQKKIGEELKKK